MDWGVELEVIPFAKVYSLENPERKANSIPDVLPAPSMVVLGLWVSYLISTTLVLSGSWGGDVNMKGFLPKPLSLPLH